MTVAHGPGFPAEHHHLWWICFHCVDAVRDSRWQRFLSPPGFDHCFLIGKQRHEDRTTFQYLEWTRHRLEVVTVHADWAAAVMDGVRERQGNILLWTGDPIQANRGLRFAWGWYCVPLVQHVVGLPGLAITPLQLARHLLRAGARYEFRGLNSAKAETIQDARG